MLESGSSGSVRGVLSNEHPYREPRSEADVPPGDQRRATKDLQGVESGPDQSATSIFLPVVISPAQPLGGQIRWL